MNVTTFRWIIWSMVAVCLAVLVVLGGFGRSAPFGSEAQDATSGATAKIGGPFSMTAHTGETVTEKTYAGKGWLVFMGFTNCPDICPRTLAEMSSWFDALGPEADKLRGFLVSVDPERDTIENLKLYMSSFDPRIVALRPEPSELAGFAKAFKVYYEKVDTGGGDYTMDHTAGVLLFDRDGDFSGTIDMHEDRDVALQKIRRLVE
ncbi:SCO family protein [Mesorhizobium sp. VNQ89]|jgi:protein SCO1/2|uniref:SCO family protein n=1 Tax=Mesorhizobium quangtriensis TaxID=3157709 RepID=UPI0032B7E218